MRSVSRFMLLALSVCLAGHLLLSPDDARGGLVSSALIGVLQTTNPADSMTVIFRAVDMSGHVVWECDPEDIQRSTRSRGQIHYMVDVPTETAGRMDLEMTMWVYAVRAPGPVSFGALTLRDQTGQSYAGDVPTIDLRGRAAEAFVQVNPQ